MPIAQLLSGAAELTANELLQFDSDYQTYLAPLAEKSLAITLLPVDLTVVLFFTAERIDISVPVNAPDTKTTTYKNDTSDANADDIACDCHLTLQISALSELRDTNQLTKLIKQDKLDIVGDLRVAQHLSALINGINLDLTEILTVKLGDVPAHTIMGVTHQIQSYLRYVHEHAQITLGEALIEEKKWVASPLAIANYCDEVTDTRYWCDRIAARIQRLERQQAQATHDDVGSEK